MQYRTLPPPPQLAEYVKYLWTVEVDHNSIDAYRIRTYVDDSSGIIFQQGVSRSAIRKDGILIPPAFVYGQTTTPTINECLSAFSCVGVLFYPHVAHELFGFHSSLLTDTMLEWTEIGELKTLSDSVLNATSSAEGIDVVVDYLKRVVSTRKKRNVILSKQVVRYINHNRGMIQVRDITEYFKISERSLERQFHTQIGVTPRHFIQVTRFQEVIRRFRSGGDDRMIDIAYDLNFSDQAHFNTMIRKLADITPKMLRESVKSGVVNVFLERVNDLQVQ